MYDNKIFLYLTVDSLKQIIKLVSEDDSMLEMHIFANKVIFKIKDIIISSRKQALISGLERDLLKEARENGTFVIY